MTVRSIRWKVSPIIGGEFPADPASLLPSRHARSGLFLAGGRACLRVISSYLREHKIGEVLLPEYICEAVPDTLAMTGLRCRYYAVDDRLQPDPAQVQSLASPGRALLYINYFGFPPTRAWAEVLLKLGRQGILRIEDNAMGGSAHPELADFSFDSLRKFAPFDGAWLVSRFQLPGPPAEPDTDRLNLIRDYRRGLAAYQEDGRGSQRMLNALYQRAEAAYSASRALAGDSTEREGLERTDWLAIAEARRRNFMLLQRLTMDIPQLSALLPSPASIEEGMPIAFPVRIPPGSQAHLLAGLAGHGFGAMRHWPGRLPTPHARQLARTTLSLPIDPRATPRDLRRLSAVLAGLMASLPASREGAASKTAASSACRPVKEKGGFPS